MDLSTLKTVLDEQSDILLGGVPDGYDGLVLSVLARAAAGRKHALIFVARDARRMMMSARTLEFFAPDVEKLIFPAWDCVPYDRVSPNAEVSARRMSALHRLSENGQGNAPLIVMTTANAVIQRVPARTAIAERSWSASVSALPSPPR